jgi:hypothetical protein
MPRVNSLVSDFSAGEIAPFFFGKTMNPVYYKGVSLMVNFMPRPQGGFRKAPGSIICGHTGGPDATAQIYCIKISVNLAYVLEFTNNLVRFWKFTNNTLTYLAGKDIVTTYTAAETSQLQFAWMFPDLFITHQNHPPARIRWSTGDNFAKQNINFVTTSFTFTAVFATGTNTLTNIAGVTGQTAVNLPLPSASASGQWVLTDNTTPANIPAGTYITQVYPSATPSLTISAASAVLSANAAGNSAVLPGDSLTLTQATLPFQSAGNYPRCVAVAYQRVFFANTANQPQTVWSSIIGVWDSGDPQGAAGNMNVNLFEATTYQNQTMIQDAFGNPTTNPPGYTNTQATQNAVSDSDGIAATLTETESELLWITGSHDLIIGAADGEIVIPANTGSVVGISPNTISDNQVSRMGSAPIQGSVLINGVVFVQLSGLKVREMVWQGVSNSYDQPKDLSFFSGHLFIANPIVGWDFAQTPDTVAYFQRADGTLACLNYDPANGVMAWWQRKTRAGDVITSCAVTTGPNGDVLFLAVTRGAYNYIEQVTSPDWTDCRLSCYMDCATQKYNAVAYTTIAVDASFNGQTLGVVADGKYLGTAVPVGGVLTLPGGVKANYVTVGYLYVTPQVNTLPISPEGKYGPGLTDLRNIDHVGLILYNTLDIQVGILGGSPDPVPEVAATVGANPTPYTGFPESASIQTSNLRNPIVTIQSVNPLPCEVSALVPVVTN